MKNILKVVSIFMIILLFSVNVFALPVTTNWDHLSKIVSELSISNYGIASASSSATFYDGDSISIEMNLQQLKSSGWTTIKTWKGSGTIRCDVAGSWAVYSGYDYRVESIARVYDSNGNELEEGKVYSPIKHY